MELRAATTGDSRFLEKMLLEAFNRSGGQVFSHSDVEAHPRLGRYVRDWPQADDFGVVTVEDDIPIARPRPVAFPPRTRDTGFRRRHTRAQHGC